MESTEDKIQGLDKRIKDLNDEILKLEETKVNLMVLKRDFQMDDTRKVLKSAFEETLEQVDDETRKEVYKRFEEWN